MIAHDLPRAPPQVKSMAAERGLGPHRNPHGQRSDDDGVLLFTNPTTTAPTPSQTPTQSPAQATFPLVVAPLPPPALKVDAKAAL